jgi:hypothetical protein
MLGADLVPSRHLGNNCPREIGLRDDPALLFLGPTTPAANASPDFYTATRPRTVKYIVDHICEPISPNRSTSADLSKSPQGAVKRPLTVQEAVKLVFDKVEELGSVRQALCWLHECNLDLPVKQTDGDTNWRRPSFT